MLVRHCLNAHSSTAIEWLYSDTGKYNLKSLIQIRRLMYLWHILSRNDTELIRRLYQAQKNTSSAGDWVKLVESDKQELNISLTDSEIQGVSKQMFKSYIKEKVKINYLNHLISLKTKHSKSEHLDCTQIQMAEYISDQSLSTSKKHLLFKLRSKTLDVKQNFKNKHPNPWCLTCGLFPETQSHILQCPPLVENLNYLKGKTSKIDETMMVYKNIKQQIMIVNIYSNSMR